MYKVRILPPRTVKKLPSIASPKNLFPPKKKLHERWRLFVNALPFPFPNLLIKLSYKSPIHDVEHKTALDWHVARLNCTIYSRDEWKKDFAAFSAATCTYSVCKASLFDSHRYANKNINNVQFEGLLCAVERERERKIIFRASRKTCNVIKRREKFAWTITFCWVGQECRKSFVDKRNINKLRRFNEASISSRLKSLLINQITPPIRCLANCRTQKVTMKSIHEFDQFEVFAEVDRNSIGKCQQVGLNLIKNIFQHWNLTSDTRMSHCYSINVKRNMQWLDQKSLIQCLTHFYRQFFSSWNFEENFYQIFDFIHRRCQVIFLKANKK